MDILHSLGVYLRALYSLLGALNTIDELLYMHRGEGREADSPDTRLDVVFDDAPIGLFRVGLCIA